MSRREGPRAHAKGDAQSGYALRTPIVGWKSVAWLEMLPTRRVALHVPDAKAFDVKLNTLVGNRANSLHEELPGTDNFTRVARPSGSRRSAAKRSGGARFSSIARSQGPSSAASARGSAPRRHWPSGCVGHGHLPASAPSRRGCPCHLATRDLLRGGARPSQQNGPHPFGPSSCSEGASTTYRGTSGLGPRRSSISSAPKRANPSTRIQTSCTRPASIPLA